MTEKKIRAWLVQSLWIIGAFPVENSARPGTPDICTKIGWIELKIISIPRSENSVMRIGLRKTQRAWMRRWSRVNGTSFLLCITKCGSWFFHTGKWAAEHADIATYSEFKSAAAASFIDRPAPIEIVNIMRSAA